ncbi:hypothetical protein [Variovorax sp. KK3]|uniref:hypothetical protein n=1 Tax=Variovorax sp. KK3 TaxID=1855728 RepID=UPI00097BB509|nr:hypothetical protein [Variovorax sp. KK3]
MSVLLNSMPPHDRCKGIDLAQSDGSLDALFVARGLDPHVIQFNPAELDTYAEGDEYNAEYFFYCDFDFLKRGQDRVAKFVVPHTFLRWGHSRLQRPTGSPGELRLQEFGGDIDAPDFVRHCATNYLVKNFWHNFVHRAIQGIATHNYHQFRGAAREDSDFQSDNISNILLVRSYGLPVYASASIGADNAAQIRALFYRNRCNLIFAERARHRHADRAAMSVDEQWAEAEWRYRRSLANAISMRLVVKGLAAPSVSVFFNGRALTRERNGTERRWRTGSVVVEIASRRIDTGRPPYLPADELGNGNELTQARLNTIRMQRTEREREIVQIAVSAYEQLLRSDTGLRRSIASNMNALAERIAIPPLH